jgi:hypothetical protein
MSTVVVLNPTKGFTIANAQMSADQVTGATIEFGPTSGGPYTTIFAVPAALVTAGEAAGSILVPIGDVTLPSGVSYCVATISNAAGQSAISDEVGVQLLGVPSAPTFSVA